ncbi:MAG: hypothetical protein GWN02_26640, partial [Gemmatimonadetes bacterium]|nr:hypothetical protein [Gemmatimonadota bacterium]
MTQKPTERLGSSGQYTWLWMVASVIVVAAFMFWLAATSEPSGPQVVEATDEGSELNTPGVVTVTVDELVAGLGSYAGTDVRLEGIQVASRLGAQAFWTTTSSGVPFLVRLTPALVADSFAVAGGESLTLIG